MCAVGAGLMQAPGLFESQDTRGNYGLVHNIGLGGAAVISLLRQPEFYHAGQDVGGTDGCDRQSHPQFCPFGLIMHHLVFPRLAYNRAHELQQITSVDVDNVKFKAYPESLLQPTAHIVVTWVALALFCSAVLSVLMWHLFCLSFLDFAGDSDIQFSPFFGWSLCP